MLGILYGLGTSFAGDNEWEREKQGERVVVGGVSVFLFLQIAFKK